MQLILWPAIITLAITLLRLAGELLGWSPRLFNPVAGGGGSLIGISWLPPLFGVYFAWKLAKSGQGPAMAWKAPALALLGILVNVLGIFLMFRLELSQLAAIAAFALVSVIAVAITFPGWPALGRTLLAYAFAARVPVAVIMLIAIFGNWGTHYDVAPPNGLEVNQMAPIVKWFWIGLIPQMTVWINVTVVMGALFGGLAVAVLKPRPATA